MDEKSIIREAMKEVGWNQIVLAEKMGYKSQSGLANRITQEAGKMKIETLVRILDTLGYEVVVRSKSRTANKSEWVVDCE